VEKREVRKIRLSANNDNKNARLAVKSVRLPSHLNSSNSSSNSSSNNSNNAGNSDVRNRIVRIRNASSVQISSARNSKGSHKSRDSVGARTVKIRIVKLKSEINSVAKLNGETSNSAARPSRDGNSNDVKTTSEMISNVVKRSSN
jgi:hypothetical protein